jgi:hypothetical protein
VTIGDGHGFVVGGVVYRSMVHTAHLGSVVNMVGASIVRGNDVLNERYLTFLDLDYVHSSNLPVARADWLRRQVNNATSARWAVSVDSDSEFDGASLYAYLADDPSPPAIVIVPMFCGGGGRRLNVVMGDMRLSVESMTRRFAAEKPTVAITAGGFGVAAFYLPWFRGNWRDVRPERSSIDSVYGEDIDMCLAVARRGGRIGAVPIDSRHHDLIAADRSALAW